MDSREITQHRKYRILPLGWYTNMLNNSFLNSPWLHQEKEEYDYSACGKKNKMGSINVPVVITGSFDECIV